ncbi:MAG TPA: cyclic nucleotide-binding domain-containing protein, partial [Myxococcota bacterium]
MNDIDSLVAALRARPGDLRARKMLGDAYRAAGKPEDAAREYKALVGAYAAQGLVFRAIAACKSVLDVAPGDDEAARTLAELYAKRSAGKESAELPKALSAALIAPDDDSAEGPPISLPSGEAVLVEPPPMPADAGDDEEVIDVTALAAALTPLPQGAVRLERPAAVPLFSGLAPDSFTALVHGMSAWEAEPGAIIVGEGDAGDSVFVVVRGQVKVERGGVVLATLGADSFFGEMALLSRHARAATVSAVGTAQLLEIPRAVLEGLVDADPGVAVALDAFCRARLLENLARTSPLLRELPPSVVDGALGQFATKKVPAGERLIEEGAAGPGLFVVLAGALDVVATSGLGQTRVKQLGPGDVFGEMSLLSGDAATAS